jgi:hypothetical protein
MLDGAAGAGSGVGEVGGIGYGAGVGEDDVQGGAGCDAHRAHGHYG